MILTVGNEFPRYPLTGVGEDHSDALKPFSNGLRSASLEALDWVCELYVECCR